VSGGCLDPVNPGDATVATVQVTFDGTNTSDTIRVRGTTRARAAALAHEGYDLGRSDFSFTSSNESVAVVEATGVVRAVGTGTAVIRAVLPGGAAGEGEVVVVPSSVEYTIPVGNDPGALAFSPDYTRLYVVIGPDSLAMVDALGYFRLSALRLGMPGSSVAATASAVYVTHPAANAVSVISTATNTVLRTLAVGPGPAGAAATAEHAFVAVRGARRVAVLGTEGETGSIAVAGDPQHLSIARDGRRLFATVDAGSGAWQLVVLEPSSRSTLQTIALSSPPAAVATDLSGTRAYVLLPAEGRVAVFAENASGQYVLSGTVTVGSGATGVSARLVGVPLVVASGAPVTVFDGGNLVVSEQIAEVGTGHVAVRPDGIFAFISSAGSGVLRVIGL
jgi:YVTN family beta-propeller protein